MMIGLNNILFQSEIETEKYKKWKWYKEEIAHRKTKNTNKNKKNKRSNKTNLQYSP